MTTPDFRTTNDPEAVLTREDGSEYPVVMVLEDETVFAGSYDDLMARFLPDYPVEQTSQEEADRADDMRFSLLVEAGNAIQLSIANQAAERGILKEDASEALIAAVGMPRSERLDLPSGRWDIEDLPLVLLTSHYAPFSEHPAPEGAIIWLDPTDARTTVLSLASAEGIQVFENPDGVVSGADGS